MLFPAALQVAGKGTSTWQDETAEEASADDDARIIQTLLRLPDFDFRASEKASNAVQRELRRRWRSAEYLELVDSLSLHEEAPRLVKLCLTSTDANQRSKAATLLSKFGKLQSLADQLSNEDEAVSVAAAEAVGRIGSEEAVEILHKTVNNGELARAVRNTSLRGLGRNLRGQQLILDMVIAEQLPDFLKFAAANALHGSPNAKIRQRAKDLLPLPAGANAQPLPPIDQLKRKRGDAKAGKLVFNKEGTCNKCHIVQQVGKAVGPDLSEIGSKLSREALYVSILDPSAGISHNYESYALITADGEIATGILVSKTDDGVTLKNAEGIDKQFKTDDIVEFEKQPISLMPADLQRNLNETQLVDLVEYLTTLKKKSQ